MKMRAVFLAIAGALATTVIAMPAMAQFSGGPYFNPGLPPPPSYGRGYGPPPYAGPPGYGPISCGEGAGIVASQGFRGVSPRECSGRVYRYSAFRRGVSFEVRVSSRTGQITMIRPVRG